MKKRYTLYVSETVVRSWKMVDVETDNEQRAKQIAKDLSDAEEAEHATKGIETTILALDNGPDTRPCGTCGQPTLASQWLCDSCKKRAS